MQKIISFVFASLIIVTSFTHSFGEQSQSESVVEVATRLQQRYDKIESLSFNFHQDTRGEMTGKPRKGSGRAVFYKDGISSRMRWDYISPDKQILVSDGKEFSMYFANLQQMIVTPAESLDSDLTYSFFTGKGNLVEDFQIDPPDDNVNSLDKNTIQVIKLIPNKQQSQVQDIHLWISADSLLRRISIRDHFGTITVLNFSDINIDILSDTPAQQIDDLFTFIPPEDTEIIYQ